MEPLLKEIPRSGITYANNIQSLIEYCADGIAVLSVDCKLSYISPSVERILGYSVDEIMQLDWFSLIHVEDSLSLQTGQADVAANPGVPMKCCTRRMRHKDGRWRWIETTVTNMLQNPDVSGIIVNFHDITEKKEAEDSLRNVSRLYKFNSQINHSIIHANDEQTLFSEACRIAAEVGKFDVAWIGVIDEKNRKINFLAHHNIPTEEIELYSNMTYCENGPISNVLAHNMRHIINDYSAEPVLSEWAQYAFTRGFQSTATFPIRKTGGQIYILSLFSRIAGFFNEQEIKLLEKATSEISFALDVFEKDKAKKLAEDKLKHNEIHLKQAQAIAHLGSWELDAHSRMICWSEEGCKIYGLSPGENIQSVEAWLSYVHPDDLERVKKINWHSETTLEPTSFFYRIVRHDGSVRHLYSTSHVEFDIDGKAIGMHGIAHDVTEMKNAEDALRQSEENLHLIIDLIPNPIFKKDYNGNFIFANKSFAALYGLTPEKLIDRPMSETIPRNNDHELFLGQDKEVIDSGITKIIPEMQFTDYNGEKRIFFAVKVPYSIPGSEKTAVLAIAHDITEQKAAAERTLQANRLYAFSSQINQAILHTTDELSLFKEICRIAVETGKFDAAWVCLPDETNRKVEIFWHHNIDSGATGSPGIYIYDEDDPLAKLLKTNSTQIVNDYSKEQQSSRVTSFAVANGYNSSIALPIYKCNQVLFTLNLFSKNLNFFSDQEIKLLEEATNEISFALDVFEKDKQKELAEEKLRHNEIRLKQAQAIAHVGSWELDFATGLSTWSEEACSIYGLLPEDNIQTQKSWETFIHPDDRVSVLKALDDGAATLSNTSVFHRIIRKDGMLRRVHSYANFELNSEGKPTGMYGVTYDVTDMKEAEDALRLSQSNLHLIIDLIPQPIFKRNYDGKFIFVNKYFAALYGHTPKQLINQTIDFAIPDKNIYEVLAREDRAVIDSGSTKIIPEQVITDSTGKERIFYTTKVPYTIPGLNEKVILGIGLDITEQKIAEQKIIQANRLYAFISQINQTILHTSEERILLGETCRIAVDTGKFEVAWVGRPNETGDNISLVASSNMKRDDMDLFDKFPIIKESPMEFVLTNNQPYVINDYDMEPAFSRWVQFPQARGFQSSITLPITKSGKVNYMLLLFSKKADFFNEQEIKLLKEATGEISFALDVFEKDKLKAKAERDLKHNEHRMHQAQEIAHLGSWELDFATKVVTWSDEAKRIHGVSVDYTTQTYDSWLSFVHPEDMGYVVEITKNAILTTTNMDFFHRIVRKDGEIRHVHSLAHFEYNQAGTPTGLYGATHDVTEMKETEDALRQSQTNLRLITDLIPQPISAKDYNGKFIFVNKSFSDAYGLSDKQLSNRSISETIPDVNESSYFIEQDKEIIDTGATKVIPEQTFTDSKGELRTFYTTKVPYTIPRSNKRAVLAISQDITDRKKAEAERNKMVDDLLQRNKDLEQFSYIISHNLRAPVANILGLTNLIKTVDHNKADEEIALEGLYTSAQKLDVVIRDLNYILQLKQNVNEHKVKVKCSEILADIKSGIKDVIKREGVEIYTDFSATDELLTLKSYWYSIFYNLVSNSIKYRQPGIRPIIEIKSVIEDGNAYYIFRDNGLGIDLEKKGEQLFGLYKRFHFHTEGKGMGLYMVKTQVERLGGKISVESEINKGTIFTIVLDNI